MMEICFCAWDSKEKQVQEEGEDLEALFYKSLHTDYWRALVNKNESDVKQHNIWDTLVLQNF